MNLGFKIISLDHETHDEVKQLAISSMRSKFLAELIIMQTDFEWDLMEAVAELHLNPEIIS